MPQGYWRQAFHVLWQTTLLNSVIIVGANWAFLPFDLHSLFAPVAAVLLCLLLTLGALVAGSIFGMLASIISKRAAIWSAGIGFNLIYCIYCFNMEANYAGDPTRGMDGYQFLLAIVALGIWLVRMMPSSTRPGAVS